MSSLAKHSPETFPSLGTLAKLPLELRVKIYTHVLSDAVIDIDEDGMKSVPSTRQQLPRAMEQDISNMNIDYQACAFTFPSPGAFHVYLAGLSKTQKSLLTRIRILLLAPLKDWDDEDSASFGALMDPGWQSCFRILPHSVREVTLDLNNPHILLEEHGYTVSHCLAKFSTIALLRTKRKARFQVCGCERTSSLKSCGRAKMNSD